MTSSRLLPGCYLALGRSIAKLYPSCLSPAATLEARPSRGSCRRTTKRSDALWYSSMSLRYLAPVPVESSATRQLALPVRSSLGGRGQYCQCTTLRRRVSLRSSLERTPLPLFLSLLSDHVWIS